MVRRARPCCICSYLLLCRSQSHLAVTCEDILDNILHAGSLPAVDLARLATVHTSWVNSTRKALYRSVDAVFPDPRLAQTLEGSPRICSLVREMKITVYNLADTDAPFLDSSLRCIPLTALVSLSIHCDGGWPGDMIARHSQRWDIPSLRAVSVQGVGMKMPIPHSVDTLTLVAFTLIRLRHMPVELRRFKHTQSTGLHLEVIKKYSQSLVEFNIEFGNGQPSSLYDSDPFTAGWDWPRRNSLQRLILVCSEPLYLKLGSTWLHITFLRISVCLLETNVIPRTVVTLELVAPGIFTEDLTQRLLVYEGGDLHHPVNTQLVAVHIETAYQYRAVGILEDHAIRVTIQV
ncbi:hypothetical protein AURDEDRAFT_173643 [Auricularia subglabra TFB-10046 SS5]|nr:hypothetical protein AURDEDRAFT_173643 [Auricularia subglabra TFB-10046 SS5]